MAEGRVACFARESRENVSGANSGRRSEVVLPLPTDWVVVSYGKEGEGGMPHPVNLARLRPKLPGLTSLGAPSAAAPHEDLE
jgi:hypothetical protein